MLSPCPGCGVLFPHYDGPTHRYLGASAACWALFSWSLVGQHSLTARLLEESRIAATPAVPTGPRNGPAIEELFCDAYGVQHHGEDSPQAVQSVAVHLLNIHGVVTGKTTKPRWAIDRALRTRGVFHRLEPPPLGSALTFRHLFPGGGVVTPVTRSQYTLSVYEAWMALHGSTVEEWWDRYVAPDETPAPRAAHARVPAASSPHERRLKR